MIVTAWAGWMRAAGQSERTIHIRVSTIRRFEQGTHVAPERAQWTDIAEWFADNPQWSQNTRHTYFAALRAFYRWLVITEHRTDDPMAKLKAPRIPRRTPRPITVAALERVLSSVRNRRTKMMMLLAFFQGLRVHEIARMRGEYIIGGDIRVLGKGGTDVLLPLHPAVAALASEFPAADWWFSSPRDRTRPIGSHSVTVTIANTMRRAGVDATAHRLRHTMATEMLAAGTDIRVVQECLRHANLASTQIYTKVNDAARRAAFRSLPLYPDADSA